MEELTTGQYVMVTDGGYAPDKLDGSWVTVAAPIIENDTVTDAAGAVWTITVANTSVKLTDSNGTSIAPSGGNTNGIKSGDYSWAVAFADGKFTFAGTGDDTVKLASNTASGYKFRAYKNGTISGNPGSYPCNFTLYKLVEGETGGEVKEIVATPTGTSSGDIKVGETVSFFCETEGASINVKINGGEYAAYTAPIAITQNTTVTVKATKDGMNDSAEATFTYRAYEMKTQYALAETIEAGDQVVIYNPASKKAMTSEVYVYTKSDGTTKDELVAVDAAVSNDVLSCESDKLAVLTVSKDESGNYRFASGGKYLYLDGTNVNFADEAGDNTLFALETATNGYYIKSVNAVVGGKVQYLEYFKNYFTCFGLGSGGDAFAFQFYKAGEVKSYLDEQTTDPEEPEEPETPAAAQTATLVTDASALAFGDEIIIVAQSFNDALSTDQQKTYRGQAEVTKNDDKTVVTFGEDTQILTLAAGTAEGTWALDTGAGYLYAAGQSKANGASSNQNYLKTQTTLDDNGSWSIEIDATGAATIKAQGDNACNWLRYNNASTRFSCYLSGQQDIAIYKVDKGAKRESGIVTDLSTLQDGDTVVVFNPAYNKAMSATAKSSYYRAGADVTLTDGVLSGYGDTELWTLGIGTDDDGNAVYTFTTAGGKKLSMNESNASLPLDAVNDTWLLKEATTDNCFYVINKNRVGDKSGDPYYVEWKDDYNEFTTYFYYANSESIYAQQLYLVIKEESSGSGEGETEEPDTPTVTTIADGDYVIWNPNYKMALSNSFSGNYMLGTAVTPVGDTVTGYGNIDIWTVKNNDDGTFTIGQDGKYFGNNASGYIVVEEAPARPNWKFTALDDGTVYLTNVGSDKQLEWFARYSDWSMFGYSEADKAMFALKFTPAATLYETDSDVVKDIAQWGGGGPYDATVNATQVLGDRYAVGDQKDTNAVFTVVAEGVTAQPYQTTTPSTGGTSYYMGAEKIGVSAGDYMQLAVNTAGWGDMTLAFRLRATKTAPGSFQVCYSTDNGTTWQNFNTGSYAYAYTAYDTEGCSYPVNGEGDFTDGMVRPSFAATRYVSFALDVPAGADNCENLLIRLVAGTTRADGDTTKGISGNIRIDSVVLSGSPILDDSVTAYVTVEPNGEDDDQPAGTALTMSSEEGATISYRVDGGKWQTYDPENKPTLESLPCDVEAYAKAEGKSVSAVMLYHYAAGTVANVKMEPNGGGVYLGSGDPKVITMTCATENATIYYKVSTDNKVWPESWTEYGANVETDAENLSLAKGFGKYYVKAYAVRDGFTDSNVVTRTFTELATATYSIYFGQIHSHTNISDGAGTIEEAYNHAKNIADHIDFLAVTDHSNSFDNTSSGVLDEDASLVSEEWKLAKETAEKYTDESFVGLYGYEMTWSNGLGHMNTYNTPGFQSRTQSDYTTYSTALKNYYNTLTTVNDSISQFNHPGTTFGDFQDFAYYTEEYDELITLIEVGNGEGAIGSSGYFPSYEYYTRALDKGWHVAPTNNQDNHKGSWGNANTGRTVVLTDSLTEEGIYDAMRNYRVYATEDNDLNIYYTLNGNIMGSILDLGAADTLELKVELSDTTDDGTSTVEVIVNGGLIAASKTVTGSENTVIFTLDNDYSYYYIRVTQGDGDIAVTAPVWTGEVEACGISNFTTDAAVAVQDQEMNLTLELYNNEKKTLELQSIVFQLGDDEDATVIHTADLTDLAQVKKLSTASYTFAYTHHDVGTANIYAVVTATLNGVEKVYKEKLELTFVPDEMVTRVIVDGTHYNDYVTGYYGGNINNLTTIAAESHVEVSIVKDEITAEMLKNCALLIISAPAKKGGTANTGSYVAKPFEDEFIQLVVDYVKDGGSVVLCGIADFGEKSCGADLHTAAQINKLLTALGSTMRLNDDEVFDLTHNGGQPYRLYPENFNMDSKWCADLVEGQQYSQYSGCSVNPGDGTWLVKGFETTCSGDTDSDGVGVDTENKTQITYTDNEKTYTYDVVTKEGEVVFLATEETAYGGDIFLAGGVFVSDFEVKAELDNIWDLPYANRTIIETILADVQVELPVSSIADMRKGKLGDVFRIRGYVTAGTANENTTFFDAIYVQDETGGTTVFPFSLSGVEIGTPIEIIGYVDEYQGDREIQVMSYEILDADSKIYEPATMPNKDAMDYANNGGKLIRVEGRVVSVEPSGEKGVAQFELEDSQGDRAKVFIDGYILSGTTGKNELASFVRVGNTVSAVGLLYLHPEGSSEESVAVLRVRDCDEVVCIATGYTRVAYPITLNTYGGVIRSGNVSSYYPGERVALPTDVVREGYTFLGWYDASGTRVTAIGENETGPKNFFARWQQEEETPVNEGLPFVDVTKNDWYYADVEYVYTNGLMIGTGNGTTFSPEETLDRAQLVTILYRMAGSPTGAAACAFSDVLRDQWYTDAVDWAVENGIVKGYDNGLFGTTDPVTREQLATMLFRYAVYSGMDFVTLAEHLGGFADADAISPYAVSALNWAVGAGLIKGAGGNRLLPGSNASRAQVAAIIHRYLSALEG